jgi:GTP cyclohydrolase IA
LNKELFENSIKNILTIIGEDPEREGLARTPERVFKAFGHICGGYEQDPESIIKGALFESSNDQMVVVRDIEFYSLCEHHMLPFFGRAHVAYIPDGKVVGLSKIPRVVNVFARRLQIQERMTEQIADAIMQTVKPQGVGVVVSARHMCMEMRGVEKICASTTTSALRGIFYQAKTRNEFFDILNSGKELKV